MVIHQCDFCNLTKTCGQVVLENKEYDICEACKLKLEKKLKGKGRPSCNTQYYWPTTFYFYTPYIVPTTNPSVQPYPYIWGGTSWSSTSPVSSGKTAIAFNR